MKIINISNDISQNNIESPLRDKTNNSNEDLSKDYVDLVHKISEAEDFDLIL